MNPIEPPKSNTTGLDYGPYRPTTVPKWDVLQRDSMPDSDGLKLQWRASPIAWLDDVSHTVRKTVFMCVVVWAANSFLIVPVARHFGGTLFGAASLPFWVMVSIGCGVRTTLKERTWDIVIIAFLTPLLTPLLLSIVFASSRSGEAQFVGMALTFLLLVTLVDGIATHYFYWLTAHPYLQGKESDSERKSWARRFLLERRLICYPLGFGVLLVLFDLHRKSPRAIEAFWSMLIFFSASSLLWAFRRGTSPSPIAILKTTCVAFVRFLCWGRWEGRWGSETPGVFVSPCGPATVRQGYTFLVFFMLSAVFSRSVTTWVDVSPFGGNWPWILLTSVLGTALMPLVLVLSLFLAVAGRELTLEEERVEALHKDRADEPLWSAIVDRLLEEDAK